MTLEIVVRSSAAVDIAEAREWYEAQQTGLGKSFLDAIEAAFGRIAERPHAYPIVTGDARKALLPRFPYSIYFRIRPGQIRILGVIHQHRDPRVWRRRVAPGR